MKVKVHYLFSKSKKIGSKLITFGTNHLTKESEVPSHIAVLIQDRWVFEATALNGVRVHSYSKWKEDQIEVAKISFSNDTVDYGKIKKIFKTIKNKKYDWLGVSYFGLRVALNKLCGTGIPSENLWENKNRYFCCEAVAKLTGAGSYSMKAPVQLLDEFKS